MIRDTGAPEASSASTVGAPTEPVRRNCDSCRHGGLYGSECFALTLDEEEDRPIVAWLDAAGMRDDGTVPADADGCPGWVSR
jgi:hypothetical protein